MLNKATNKIIDTCFFYLLAIVIISLPFLLTNKAFFLLNRLSIGLVVLIWLVQIIGDRKVQFSASKFFLMGFFLLYLVDVIGLFYSENSAEAASVLEKKIPLLIIPLVILTGMRLVERRVDGLLKLFAGSVTVASLICLVYAFHRNNYIEGLFNPNWFYFSYYDLTEIIGMQPVYLSLYVSFSFFIVLFHWYKFINKNFLLMNILMLIWLLYLFIFLLLLSGKTAIAATVIIFVAIVFLFFIRSGRILQGIVSAFSVIVISILLVYKTPVIRERFFETFGMNRTSSWVYGDPKNDKPMPEARIVKWRSALNVINKNWLIGVGTGDVQYELNKEYNAANFQSGIDENFNAHNQFLQTWMSSGLIGLAIFFFILIQIMIQALRAKNYLYLVFALLFVMCCVTEAMLERQFGILIFTLFGSLLYAKPKPLEGSKTLDGVH